jgi:hypothetical protein
LKSEAWSWTITLPEPSWNSTLQRKNWNTVIFYGVSITDADLIMTNGKSLEYVGVTPDELILPTATDLAGAATPCWRTQRKL